VTHFIHEHYPDLPEGQLAKLRASVVNTATLAEVAKRIGIGPRLLLGKGEDQSGGREKESILADAFEAILGAVFLDGGWEQARSVVLDLLRDDITHGAQRPGRQDYKTRLQELAAERNLGPPTYQLSATGPDHDRRFAAIAMIDGVPTGAGSGTSKKRAEQDAARVAWQALASDDRRSTETPSPLGKEKVDHAST
jgi:ribonuclease-3